MFAHVLLAVSMLFVGGPGVEHTTGSTAVVHAIAETVDPDPAPRPTINEFLPEDRAIGECISALPKPGCGSEARGGWRQGLVLLAILIGIAFIAWRVVRSARRARTGAEAPSVI